MTTIWKVLNSFEGKNYFDIGRFAVLILNRPITVPKTHILDLWNEASFRATVDGGTDRWYDFIAAFPKETSLLKQIHPDLVSGDFDSVKPKTLQRCRENNVKIVNTPDQDKTDFTKALEEIWKETKGELDSVIAIADTSGRLDHIMSNLNTLFQPVQYRLYLLGSDSLTWLLPPGSHHIQVPASLADRRVSCGLIPLGRPCRVSTTGLQWDLDDSRMEFGGLISTSNTFSKYCNGLVTVETDGPVLWTTTLAMAEEL